jgi:hypothetical protein
MEYPVMLIKDDPYVYTTPYVPFAKDGVVSFNKINIISMSAVEDDVVEFYKVVVAELRDNKVVFKKPAASKKLDELKLKQFH